MPNNEVATKQENTVMDASMMELLDQYSGAGGENVSISDMQTPRISILQALSPELKKTKAKYVEGAEEGMIYNNVDDIVYEGDPGIIVVPVKYDRHIIEWEPNRGGLVAIHDTSYDMSKCKRNSEDKLVNAAGNVIVDTPEWYVLVVEEDTGEFYPAVISMPGSQMKKSKKLNSSLKRQLVKDANGNRRELPYFASAYQFETVPDSNKKGDFFNWSIKFKSRTKELENGKEILEAAVAFYETLKTGPINVKNDIDDAETGDVEDPAF